MYNWFWRPTQQDCKREPHPSQTFHHCKEGRSSAIYSQSVAEFAWLGRECLVTVWSGRNQFARLCLPSVWLWPWKLISSSVSARNLSGIVTLAAVAVLNPTIPHTPPPPCSTQEAKTLELWGKQTGTIFPCLHWTAAHAVLCRGIITDRYCSWLVFDSLPGMFVCHQSDQSALNIILKSCCFEPFSCFGIVGDFEAIRGDALFWTWTLRVFVNTRFLIKSAVFNACLHTRLSDAQSLLVSSKLTNSLCLCKVTVWRRLASASVPAIGSACLSVSKLVCVRHCFHSLLPVRHKRLLVKVDSRFWESGSDIFSPEHSSTSSGNQS